MPVLIVSSIETMPRGTGGVSQNGSGPSRAGGEALLGLVSVLCSGDHAALQRCPGVALMEPTPAWGPENSRDPLRGVCGKGTGMSKEQEQGGTSFLQKAVGTPWAPQAWEPATVKKGRKPECASTQCLGRTDDDGG